MRRIGNLAFGLYASPDYLEAYGDPNFEDGCPGHHLIGQLDDIQHSPQFGWLANLTPHARIAFQTSSHEAAVSAALHGSGLACLARFRADREPGLVRLKTPSPVPVAGIWLVVHKDNRDTSRIWAVMTHMSDHMREIRGHLMPDEGAVADIAVEDGAVDRRNPNRVAS